jgi:hypothetical protein
MSNLETHQRNHKQRMQDEQIAAEPQLPPPELSPDAAPLPVESYLGQKRRQPVAIAGIVEKGLVRPLDPTVILPEHSRVIIVASKAG